jgi:ABC-2 type transport system ATP-binding protein
MRDVMIEARGLGKKYGGSVALANASFELRRGEILGFLGPNGAGKSTTMRILTCFIAPTSGTASVAGFDIWKDPLGVRRSIGYLPESTPLYKEMLVLEYLEWVASMRQLSGDTAKRRIRAVVEEVGLEEVIAKSIRELSKGYKQRVGLAQALIHEPPILILDEPMTGLDPNQAVEIRKLIKEIGRERSIILSTHNLAEVKVTCQRVLIIDRGRIVADDTPDTLAKGTTRGAKYTVAILKHERLDKAADAKGDPRNAFSTLRGVEAVRDVTKDENGEVHLEIVAKTEEDMRADIYRAAVENGLILVAFGAKEVNLETVFQELTSRPEESHAAHGDDEEDEDEEDEDEDESSEDEDEESEDEEEAPASEEEESEDEDEEESSEDESEDDEESSDEEDEDSEDEEEEPSGKKGA